MPITESLLFSSLENPLKNKINHPDIKLKPPIGVIAPINLKDSFPHKLIVERRNKLPENKIIPKRNKLKAI